MKATAAPCNPDAGDHAGQPTGLIADLTGARPVPAEAGARLRRITVMGLTTMAGAWFVLGVLSYVHPVRRPEDRKFKSDTGLQLALVRGEFKLNLWRTRRFPLSPEELVKW